MDIVQIEGSIFFGSATCTQGELDTVKTPSKYGQPSAVSAPGINLGRPFEGTGSFF